jgi:SNF family Na+-dependent transporter
VRVFAKFCRVGAGVVGLLAVSVAAFSIWRGLADYWMQRQEHWDPYCSDVWTLAAVISLFSLSVAYGAHVAYRKIGTWERRFHG